MRDKGSLVMGVVLVGLGALFLLNTWLHINVWGLFWPGLLILLGVVILARSRTVTPGTRNDFVLIGDVHRFGAGPLTNEDVWIGIGDLDYDLTQADIPTGETVLRVQGLIGDVKLFMPANVGLSISANGLITDAKVLGEQHSYFLNPYRYTSEGYAEAERKIKLETAFFINDVKVKRA
ncbi:MAG: cell wall-active antibiotics response protein LiaF [Anaerolineae bacterium]